MVASAVDVNHVGYGIFLAFHAFVFWVWRLRLHVASALRMGSVHIRVCHYMFGLNASEFYGNSRLLHWFDNLADRVDLYWASLIPNANSTNSFTVE